MVTRVTTVNDSDVPRVSSNGDPPRALVMAEPIDSAHFSPAQKGGLGGWGDALCCNACPQQCSGKAALPAAVGHQVDSAVLRRCVGLGGVW